MRIVYFAQDLSDAAVARRVRMLRLGGAEVTLLGFWRRPIPREIEGVSPIDLGQTFDGRLIARLALVMRRILQARSWRSLLKNADAILARNMEMVTIAAAVRRAARSNIPIVYECLDIHQSLLGTGISGKMLRAWDAKVVRISSRLMVSSPAFIVNYFNTLTNILPPTLLAENKRIMRQIDINRPTSPKYIGPPWRIGWFGNIRCVESFQILMRLANQHPDLIDVTIAGFCHRSVQSLVDQHLPLPNMRFSGTYGEPDLADLYGSCHFTWAIDYFQKGKNSAWLLPNRIYEGGYFNCPAIALDGTETASWLSQRRTGVIIRSDPVIEVGEILSNLNESKYQQIYLSAVNISDQDLVYTHEDCRKFSQKIIEQS